MFSRNKKGKTFFFQKTIWRRCVNDWAALLYGYRKSLPWPGGCGEGTEVVNWDLLEKPNDCNCIVILTLSSSHRIARRFYSTLHAFTTESNPAPLWRQRQKAKWISAEVTTEWTSSSLPLSEEAKAETKSGRYLKQYLVSEGILNDCGCQKWMSRFWLASPRPLILVLFQWDTLGGSEEFEGHNSTNASEAGW